MQMIGRMKSKKHHPARGRLSDNEIQNLEKFNAEATAHCMTRLPCFFIEERHSFAPLRQGRLVSCPTAYGGPAGEGSPGQLESVGVRHRRRTAREKHLSDSVRFVATTRPLTTYTSHKIAYP